MAGKGKADGVGYKRPPVGTRFQPGQSGNPKGRPKGSRNFGTVLDKELDTRITITENGKRKKITKREATAKQLANKGAAGDPKALPVLLNEIRFRENLLLAAPAQDLLNTAEDALVIESIVRRIREAEPAPDQPGTNSDSPTEAPPAPPTKPEGSS
jgi:hypothetical protein